MENNKKVRTVVDLLRKDKSIITINKNPIKLQYKDDSVMEIGQTGQTGQMNQMTLEN
jgi:hypothetical protein